MPFVIASRGRYNENGNISQNYEVRGNEFTNTITTVQKDNMVLVNNSDTKPHPRVRRLTPKECWRLFDFTDEDFEKARTALNNTYYHGRDKSSSRLYEQAGNTIVINTLSAILKQLNIKEHIDVVEFFCGIGAQRKALQKAGIDFTVVDAVDINKYSLTSYNAINGTNFEPQDITKWDKDIHIDMIFHSSPCQSFSLAGKGEGGNEGSGTRSSLMHETKRIVAKAKPKYVIWENVKGALSKKHRHNFEQYISDMDERGYNTYYQILNSKDYGTPQSRERVFAVSIRKDIDVGYEFPKPMPLATCLQDVLEDNVDEKYYVKKELSDKIVNSIKDKIVSNTVRAGGASLNRQTQLGLGIREEKQGIVVSDCANKFGKMTDVAMTILARDYKGFGHQSMNAVVELKSE